MANRTPPSAIIPSAATLPGLAQAGMYELAAKLAEAGYTVLTFNFRSFCPPVGVARCSEGIFVISTLYRDVEGAVTFLRERGSETVFVVPGREPRAHLAGEPA